MQLPFSFTIPKVDWTPPDLSKLPDWRDAKRICFDVETKDPDIKTHGPGNFRPGSHVVGYGFAIEDGPSFYLPIRHEGGDNLDKDKVIAYMRDQAKNFKGTLVGAHLAYDLGFADRDGVEFKQVSQHSDVLNNAVLLYELYDRYGLDDVLKREGMEGKDEEILNAFAVAYRVHPKKELYKLPGRAVDRYCRGDVEKPLPLLRRQERQIEEFGTQKIVQLESEVLPILVKMRKRGVRVDLNKVHKVMSWALTHEAEMLNKVKHLTGVSINVGDVWKAEHLARALKAAGFRVPLTSGGKSGKQKPSVDKNFLAKCGEIGHALGRARAYNKLRTTFGERILKYAIPEGNGFARTHPVFHQLRMTKDDEDDDDKGARYGRFSAEHQAIQQEPARDDEFGEMWREVYVPEDGCFWVCSDWSQQEPRIAVHYAEILNLPGAKQFADQYRSNPATDCHQMLADWTGIERKIVKNYFNGCIYGMGDGKLCRAIGRPTQFVNRNGKVREVPGPEGKAIIDDFRGKLPWVGMLTREAAKQAERKGVVWTVLGRRCNFPKDGQGNYDWTHKAFSRIGQGGAADQMKKTLVEADRAGIPIQAVVHDEFDLSCNSMAMVDHLKDLQMNTVKFNVPMLVDSEIGPSWGRLKKVSKLREEGRLDAYLQEIAA